MLQFDGRRQAQPGAAPGGERYFLDLHLAVESLKAQEGSGAKEAIAADALAAHDALKQKRPVLFLNLAKGADGRERVADQLAIHRHEAGVAGQRGALLEGRQVMHLAPWRRMANLLLSTDCSRARKGETGISPAALDLPWGACYTDNQRL